jgi:uridylate kinase
MGEFGQKYVISVGGSLVVPSGGIDTDFLNKLNEFIRGKLAQDSTRQFFLVIGGGATTRQYQKAARDVIGEKVDEEDLDWLGVHSTRLNAHLVRTIFRDIAHSHIIEHYDVIRKVTEPVVIAAGWKPGWSTDYDAVLLCKDYGAKIVVNLSNITQVYDKDPKTSSDAKPIDKISWEEFRKLVGNEWSPGMNAPFDPIAAKKAEELGVQVVVMNGKNFENLENFFNNGEFVGTTIG